MAEGDKKNGSRNWNHTFNDAKNLVQFLVLIGALIGGYGGYVRVQESVKRNCEHLRELHESIEELAGYIAADNERAGRIDERLKNVERGLRHRENGR